MDLTSPQFEQPGLPGVPSRLGPPESVPEPSNWSPVKTRREAELDSGQLAMLMTPTEIATRYQPLDADREEIEWGDPFEGDSGYRDEDDDELWTRKLDESLDYNYEFGGSLYDHMNAGRPVPPVTLSTHQFGEMGKREIVGGHHRIAVGLDMENLGETPMLPVKHERDIWTAKRSGEYT